MANNIPDESNAMSEASAESKDLPRRLNRMILVGSPEWVRSVIHRLQALGFTEVGAWSRLTPTKNPGEMISILAKRRVQE